jgi:hypothetical protein
MPFGAIPRGELLSPAPRREKCKPSKDFLHDTVRPRVPVCLHALLFVFRGGASHYKKLTCDLTFEFI